MLLGEELRINVGIDKDGNESNDMDEHPKYPSCYLS
jgi:hypothetical protein